MTAAGCGPKREAAGRARCPDTVPRRWPGASQPAPDFPAAGSRRPAWSAPRRSPDRHSRPPRGVTARQPDPPGWPIPAQRAASRTGSAAQLRAADRSTHPPPRSCPDAAEPGSVPPGPRDGRSTRFDPWSAPPPWRMPARRPRSRPRASRVFRPRASIEAAPSRPAGLRREPLAPQQPRRWRRSPSPAPRSRRGSSDAPPPRSQTPPSHPSDALDPGARCPEPWPARDRRPGRPRRHTPRAPVRTRFGPPAGGNRGPGSSVDRCRGCAPSPPRPRPRGCHRVRAAPGRA